jgi:hypothetical protein
MPSSLSPWLVQRISKCLSSIHLMEICKVGTFVNRDIDSVLLQTCSMLNCICYASPFI